MVEIHAKPNDQGVLTALSQICVRLLKNISEVLFIPMY